MIEGAKLRFLVERKEQLLANCYKMQEGKMNKKEGVNRDWRITVMWGKVHTFTASSQSSLLHASTSVRVL